MNEITEVNLKKSIQRIIESKVGEENAITSKALTGWLRSVGFENVPDLQRTARNVIRELRREGVPICSRAGRGYFWPKDLEDVQQTYDYLNGIANDQHYTAKQLKEGGINLFGRQRGLGI